MDDYVPKPILARTTVHLPELKLDQEYWVDANAPDVKTYLEAQWLVPVDPQPELEPVEEPTEEQTEDDWEF